MPNWLNIAGQILSKVPIERLLPRTQGRSQRIEELREILGEAEQPRLPPQLAEEPPLHRRGSRRVIPFSPSPVSDEETLSYQKREVGKLLLRMERHFAQRLRIAGVPCDCGSQKHLLDMESLCEETISMDQDPDIYYRIMEWIKEVGPKCTDEAAKSGLYDGEYPLFSQQARDFRKELIGSLEPSSLFPKRLDELPGSRFIPVVSDEEKEKIRELSHEKIEEVLE